MTEIPKILNPDFLLRMVAIESISYHSKADESIDQFKFTSLAELNVIVIEPTQKAAVLSENRYTLELLNIDKYSICYGEIDPHTFEFDTDEVKLEKEDESGRYLLKFRNASTKIDISFKAVTIKLKSRRGFTEK